MLLVDKDIRTFLMNGEVEDKTQTFIKNGNEECVTPIGYDLRAEIFTRDEKKVETYELQPGESVFVQSKELINFDSVTVGKISLKNSRIRMGLTLDCPVHQPGHTTKIFFRLTNVSSSAISLRAGEKYAMLMFEQLDSSPEHPYSGTFDNEFSFSGLGNYASEYSDQIKKIDKKIKDLESLEKNIYSNVLTILSVFVAIFTILNVNITFASQSASSVSFLAFNLATIGAIAFLSLFLTSLLKRDGKNPGVLWFLPVICFVCVACIILCI